MEEKQNLQNNNIYKIGNVGIANNKKTAVMVLIASAFLILAILGIALYFWFNGAFRNRGPIKLESQGAAEKIIEGATKGTIPSFSNNPLENSPNINPAENSNPVSKIKVNPFEQ